MNFNTVFNTVKKERREEERGEAVVHRRKYAEYYV